MAEQRASVSFLRARLLARVVLLAAALAAAAAGAVQAAGPAQPLAADPQLEARVLKVTAELRCLVCQNQTIADSHADLAVDLRNQVREMLRQGKTEAEVLAYMTARYGDFVLYRPPMKESTVLLWLGPGLLMAGGLAALVMVLRRRARAGDEAFEPDPGVEDDDERGERR
ncbi:MAG: cytochrome c-type biogenesis protein CcmH [Rubrivivax sp.]|nr:cytochrome c-type biogenesis protein CcmH [Rubrivivax sp.]